MTRVLPLLIYYLVDFFLPRNYFFVRIILLNFFGASIHPSAHVYKGCKFYSLSNLVMSANSCLGNDCIVYNVAVITLDESAVVSQYSHLCTASHDYNSRNHDLVSRPIHLCKNSWIAADCFIAPGVTIGPYGVALARSVVLSDIPTYQVFAGHPASYKRLRNLA